MSCCLLFLLLFLPLSSSSSSSQHFKLWILKKKHVDGSKAKSFCWQWRRSSSVLNKHPHTAIVLLLLLLLRRTVCQLAWLGTGMRALGGGGGEGRKQSQLSFVFVDGDVKISSMVAAVNHTRALFKSQSIVPTCHIHRQHGSPTREIYAPLMTLVK